MSSPTNIAVVIPVYQPPAQWEESCLEHIIAMIHTFPEYHFQFVVVSDGTPRRAFKPLLENFQRLHIPHTFYFLRKNQGKGKALKVGVRKTKADYYVCVDWDFPFGVLVIGDILKKLTSGSKVVIVDRGDEYPSKLPLMRRWITSSWRWCVKHMLQLPVRDTQGGTRGFSATVKPLYINGELHRFMHSLEFIVNCLKQRVLVDTVPAQLKPGIHFTNFSLKTHVLELKEFLPYIPRLWRDRRPIQPIIINADDFGMNKAVNDGTMQGIQKGVITSVSVLVTMPSFQSAVTFLRKHPTVLVGLHFDITEGKPVSKVFAKTPMVSNGTYGGIRPAIRQWLIDRQFTKKLLKELTAQYRRLAKTGLTISHLDSHQHLHAWPFFFAHFASFAIAREIPRLRMTSFSWRLLLSYTHFQPTFKQLLITSLYCASALMVSRTLLNKVTGPMSQVVLYDLNWYHSFTLGDWRTFLWSIPHHGIELICHPAAKLKGNNTIMRERVVTLQFLLKKKTLTILNTTGYYLATRLKR